MASLFHLLPTLLQGAAITVVITVGAVALMVPVAFMAGLMRLSATRLVRWPSVVFVEIFRGTSVLVQLFMFYYVLPLLGVAFDPTLTAVIVLGLNAGAYGSEVVRAATTAVARGQWDAATALNMPKWLTMRRVILPQAIVMMLPSFGNLAVQALKDTALASLITIQELASNGRVLVSETHQTGEVYILVLVIYFILAYPLIRLVRSIERHVTRGMMLGPVKP